MGLLDIKRSDSACVHCRACNNACPVGIDVAGMERVRSPECINCNECINVCPKGALSVSYVRGHNVSPSRLWGLMVGLFAAVVLITTATGDFVWINKTLEVQVKEAGQFDTQLIKGRMTLKEVSVASGVPSQTLIDRFKVTHEDFELPDLIFSVATPPAPPPDRQPDSSVRLSNIQRDNNIPFAFILRCSLLIKRLLNKVEVEVEVVSSQNSGVSSQETVDRSQ